MKKLIIILFLLMCFGCATTNTDVIDTSGKCWKSTPEPQYNGEYGYIKTPCTPDTPEYVNEVMKTWQIWETRELFVDEGRDGTCDKVYIFRCTDKEKDLWAFQSVQKCETIENQIQDFIEYKEDK